MNEKFERLWETHNRWIKGVLVNQAKEIESATIYLSDIPGIYANYALPKVKLPGELALDRISQILDERNERSTIYLIEEYQRLGFNDFLLDKGFKNDGNEAWMLINLDKYKDKEMLPAIVQVDETNFNDFYEVSMDAFVSVIGMEEYLDFCRRSLKGNLACGFSDLVSELYLIYDNGEPAAAGGLLFSKEGDFGYLHCGGTKEEFRRRGYQTALIKCRTNRALDEGISRIYTLVEDQGQSYFNYLKLGFIPIQIGQIMVK